MTKISLKNFDDASYTEIKKRGVSLTKTINDAVRLYLENNPEDIHPLKNEKRLSAIEQRLSVLEASMSPDIEDIEPPIPPDIEDIEHSIPEDAIKEAIKYFHDQNIEPTPTLIGDKVGLSSRAVGRYLSKMDIHPVLKRIDGKKGRYVEI